MTERTRINSSESFNSMKQWLMTKFQASWEGNQSNIVPTIVISRGSDKSINKMTSPANSPAIRRPSPLVNSWKNYKETPLTPQTAPHYSAGKSFWSFQTNNSQPQTDKIPRHNLQGAAIPHSDSISVRRTVQSMPCTPVQQNVSMYTPVNMSMSENYNNRIRSPLLRFTERYNLPQTGRLTPSQSSACSRSDLDSESLCGACGQRKLYGSRDFFGFSETLVDDSGIPSTVSSPKFNRRQLNLRRTSSCRAPDNLEKQIFQKSATITKAKSNLDVQKKSAQRGKRVKRTGSKESNRSTISLTRSWSINLDSFRIIKHEPAKSSTIDTRKLSLNDNELHRIKDERRRSSILRLLCHDHTDSEKEEKGDSASLSDTGSEKDMIEYSPKVTRAMKFVNNDPIQDFRSTFESSDSIKEPSIYGQIKIMFQYFNEKKELQLTLLKGSNVASAQTGILGVYTKVCLMPGKLQKKIGDDKHDTHNPVFYEPFTFKMSLDELLTQELRIKLYNKPGIFSVSEPVGECRVPLYHYDLTAVTVIWLDLNKCKGQKNDADLEDSVENEESCRKRTKFRNFLCGLGRGNEGE